MLKRQTVLVAGAAAVMLTLGVAAAGDAQPSTQRTMFLTFSHAVTLPGVVLEPGTYTFELAIPMVDQTAVSVRSGDGRRLRYLGFTHLVARVPRLNGQTGVMLGEARRGEAPPITVWYPPDDADGRRFIYR
jgi:hypothetical protein